MKCAEGEITLEEKKRLFDMFIKEVIFDGERMLIVLKTTDEPEPPERKGFSETETQAEDEREKKIEKSRAAYGLFRKRFETLPFGELKRNEIELLKMNHWRYCYCMAYIVEV